MLSLFRLKNVVVLLPPDYKSKIVKLYVEVQIIPLNNNLVLANKYFVLLTRAILRGFAFIFSRQGKDSGPRFVQRMLKCVRYRQIRKE